MGKTQCNLLIDEEVKRAAQETIKRYKHLDGQPLSLSDLVEQCLRIYVGADNAKT
jgi:hypothetical protein